MTQTLCIKIAQKPYIIGSLGPKALKYESFDAKGKGPGYCYGGDTSPKSRNSNF